VEYQHCLPKPSSGFLMSAKPHFFPKCLPLSFTLWTILLIFFSDFLIPVRVQRLSFEYSASRGWSTSRDNSSKLSKRSTSVTVGERCESFFATVCASQSSTNMPHLTRDQRRDCQLLRSIGWRYRQIQEKTGFSQHQIQYACTSRPTWHFHKYPDAVD